MGGKAKRLTIKVTEAQLTDLIACMTRMRDQTGETYAWDGDPAIARLKGQRTRLLAKLRLAAQSTCDHVEDNQGLCHNGCGAMLNLDSWEAYAGKGVPPPR